MFFISLDSLVNKKLFDGVQIENCQGCSTKHPNQIVKTFILAIFSLQNNKQGKF
jgi:Zn-finger protein